MAGTESASTEWTAKIRRADGRRSRGTRPANMGLLEERAATGAAANRSPLAHAHWDRETLRAAIMLNGGVRHVGRLAGVAGSNLSRWLNGGTGVSPTLVDRVLETIGLPGGAPIVGVVLNWTIERPLAAPALSAALRPYFPHGAEVARPRPLPGTLAAFRERHPLVSITEIYAICDGTIHALIRVRRGELTVDGAAGLTWLGGVERIAHFSVPSEWDRWIGLETLPAAAFMACWPEDLYEPSDADVIAMVRRLGLSNAQAIDRLRSS